MNDAATANRISLTREQRGLWFLAQLGDTASAAYHLPIAVRLRGALVVPAIQAALDALVRRHDGLRCRFPAIDGEPWCEFAPATNAAFPLRFLDVSAEPDPGKPVDAIAAEEARNPFDLERGPLIRGLLVRESHDCHVLFVTMHHIVSDGPSLPLIMAELAQLYTLESRGEPRTLDDAAPRMAEYARDQESEHPIAEETVHFWKDALRDAPALLALPADRVRPPQRDYRGGFTGVLLDEEITARLRDLARKNDASLFTVVFASWMLFIARLTGQNDIVTGVAMGNRELPERKGLVGNLVSMVPVRLDLTGCNTLSELIARCAASIGSARLHKSLPFDAIVNAVGVRRQPGVHPVFQMGFTWPRAPGPIPAFAELSVETLDVVAQRFGVAGDPGIDGCAGDLAYGLALHGGSVMGDSAQFDLCPRAWECSRRIVFGVEYAASLFEKRTIDRWLSHWRSLLATIVDAPTRPLSSLPLLDAAEARKVVEQLNAPRHEALDPQLLHERIARWARNTPDAVAVRTRTSTLTFAELDGEAEALASVLRRDGRAGRAIGICLQRSERMIVAVLAVLKAGGCFIPLDATHPAARIAMILEDSRPSLMICERDTAARVAAQVEVPRLDIDEWTPPTAPEMAERGRERPQVGPDDLAYVIYTSGTTGKPKGVQITHGALASFLAVSDEYTDSAPGDQVLQVSSIGFDLFLLELSASLARGATLCITPSDDLLIGETLADAVDEFAITHACITPSALSTVPEHRTLPTLRFIQCGAEFVSGALARRWGQGRTFLNVYGPTEATVIVAAHRVDAALDSDPPIGQPFANSRVYILDANGCPVPEGVNGELYIGGRGLSRGYLGLPGLTADRFLPDPFSPSPGAMMYRTGDIFRWRDNGVLHFVGRMDSQVKIRGFRIELAEVESRLVQVAGVSAALVSVDSSPEAGSRLVAHVVSARDVTAASIVAALRETLPDYMIPSAVMLIDAMPTNANGKVDRSALPRPAFVDESHFQPPSGRIEEAVASIWRDLLGVDRIGRSADFFGLGGHSLLAVQVVSRLRQALGIDVRLADVFAWPLLADFAAAIRGLSPSRLPAIVVGEHVPTPPLSFAQQRLWFLCQLSDRASRAYHMPLGLRLRGRLDAPALQRALDRLVQRQAALRTTFSVVDGAPVQVIAACEGATFALTREDLREQPDPSSAARDAAVAEADAGFDLQQGPLIRGRLLQLADDEHHLLITQHHILSDGWSQRVLIDELGALYEAGARDQDDAIPLPTVQYADYASWQRDQVKGELLRGQGDYWRRQLAGAPTILALPLDRPRPELNDHAGGLLDFTIDAPTTMALRRLARRHGTTMFQTLLSSWALLLSRLSGQTDLVIGSPSANRDQHEVEGLVGFFVNPLALRVQMDDDPTVATLLARVKQTALDALANQDIPFEQVVELLQPERTLAHNPLFQVAFAWQSAVMGELRMPGLTTSPLPRPPHRSAIFDLSLHLWDGGDDLNGVLEYAESILDAATAERWLENWRVLLAAFATAADDDVASRLPILSKHDLSFLGHCQPPATAVGPTVPALVSARIAEARHAIAIAAADATLTYGDLDRRASTLAARLVATGVQAGGRVALCLPRGAALVVAMLACWRAGAAYVPLDPRNPPARLQQLLAESRPAAMIAEHTLELEGVAACPRLVPDDDTFSAEWIPSARPLPPTAAQAPAYVIFTSGSSGRPRGVVVGHDNLANLVHWHLQTIALAPGDRCSAVAGLGFDALGWEIWPALAAGATLHLPSDDVARDPDSLLSWWTSEPLDVSFLPTPLAELAIRQNRLNPGLRTLLVGGDKLRQRADGLPFRLVNAYGPTETTVVAAAGEVSAGQGDPDVGRPIANTRVHVLDVHGQPQPVGVVGELWIAGAGVARGYFDLDAMTAERFVLEPGGSGARMYRSGDRGRWRADGTLDVLGRIDRQVKLRGIRIEPGEIETRLAEHEDIAEAAVGLVEDTAEPRLVAWLTLAGRADADDDAALRAAQVATWRELYEENYAGSVDADTLDDFTGWNSSFDGAPIPEAEMREWRDATVARIRALRGRRILEIGCGSGLLLFPLATSCERYVACDLSGETIARLRRKCARLGLSHVELSQRVATDFTGLEDSGFDVVIVNSVAQYFPDAGYLTQVIEGALAVLSEGGALFIGDLRHHGLLATFHTAVQSERSEASLAGAELARFAKAAAAADKELLLAPEFLRRFVSTRDDVGRLHLVPKATLGANELTAYRFDAILVKQPPRKLSASPLFLHWRNDGLDAAALRQKLLAAANRDVVLAAIETPHLAADRELARLVETDGHANVGDLRERALQHAASQSTLAPAALVALAAEMGRPVRMSWDCDGEPGGYHALLAPVGADPDLLADFPHELIIPPSKCHEALLHNAPLRSVRELRAVEAARAWLERVLPSHMLPSQFVVLDRMPLTANGKLDRAALPLPDSMRPGPGSALPSGDTEQRVAAIWQQTLGIDRIGRDDHFFNLGGHSLLAVQVIARVREELSTEVALADLFASPHLADFCARLDRRGGGTTRPIGRVRPGEPVPLSFAQQRLWFLAQLGKAASVAYHMPLRLELHGSLDVAALSRALDRIVKRHGALRTGVHFVDGEPRQVVAPAASAGFPLRHVDLRAYGDAAEEAAEQHVAEEACTAFDLGAGEVVRGRLLHLSEDRHDLLVTQHHIASDGWSQGVMLRELGVLYSAFAAGHEDPMPSLPLQYVDYAAWQRAQAGDSEFPALVAWWRDELAGSPPLHSLAVDLPRPEVQEYAGGSITFVLEPELVEALRAFGRHHGATLYQTVLAGWAILLARHSGDDEIVVGTATANRPRRELEGLIGFFVNTLPLRFNFEGSPSLADVVAQVQSRVLASLAHQELPFEGIVEALQPARNLAYNPLFQIAFAWQEDPVAAPELASLQVRLRPPPGDSCAKFDLAVSLVGTDDGGFAGTLVYARALFLPESAERLCAAFRTLLTAMPGFSGPVENLPVLNDTAGDELDVFSVTEASGSSPAEFLHAYCRMHARTRGYATALVQGARALTWREIDAASDRVACALVSTGLGVGDRVGVFMPRCPEAIVSFLGVLKAGGVYLPLDRDLPAERLAWVLADAAPAHVLTLGEAGPGGFDGRVLDVAALLSAPPDDGAAAASLPPLRGDEAAYVIYTSGSTGRPKGVVVDHRALIATVSRNVALFGADERSRLFQFASPGFDMSVFDIALMLGAGSVLCLGPADGTLSGERLCREIAAHAVTHVCLTPSVLATLADTESMATLQVIITGGEALPAALAKYWSRGRRLINGYGPTEAAIISTWHECSPGDVGDPPIGRPMPGVRCHVLDRHGKRVPVGVVGELHIGGVGVARGYLGRPDLDRERFLPDPFAGSGARMFRSGDLVRWRSDGRLQFLGRNDGQVKLRGFRVELGEIEAALLRLPNVVEAAVLLREDQPDEHQLVAYLVGDVAAPAILRQQLGLMLPQWMVPSAYVRVEALPLGPTGKLARSALAAPTSDAYAQAEYEQPDGELESAIAEIWSELLPRSRIGRHDDFFALGGHSLLLIRVAARLAELGHRVDTAMLFQKSTVMGLAAAIATPGTTSANGNGVEMIREGRGSPLFCLHDGSGQLLYAHRLGKALAPSLPMIGLSSPPPGQSIPHSMADYATEVCARIRRVQPTGPYRLLGWSFGGLLAHAVAELLVADGECIEFLALLDSHLVSGSDVPAQMHDEKFHLLSLMQLEAIGVPELQEALEALRAEVDAMELSELVRAAEATRLALLPAHLGGLAEHELLSYLHRQQALHHVAMTFRPGAISLEVDLFIAGDQQPSAASGWEAHIGTDARLRTRTVPGTHHSMLREPHLSTLAAELRAALCGLADPE